MKQNLIHQWTLLWTWANDLKYFILFSMEAVIFLVLSFVRWTWIYSMIWIVSFRIFVYIHIHIYKWFTVMLRVSYSDRVFSIWRVGSVHMLVFIDHLLITAVHVWKSDGNRRTHWSVWSNESYHSMTGKGDILNGVLWEWLLLWHIV